MATSADLDETARYEQSHLHLHCLHSYLFWCTRLKKVDIYTNDAISIQYERVILREIPGKPNSIISDTFMKAKQNFDRAISPY